VRAFFRAENVRLTVELALGIINEVDNFMTSGNTVIIFEAVKYFRKNSSEE
jgi:hypothetical protein